MKQQDRWVDGDYYEETLGRACRIILALAIVCAAEAFVIGSMVAGALQ